MISEEFPPYTFGGGARQCFDLAHSLAKKGIPVRVFCGRSDKPSFERLGDLLELVRLPFLDLPPRFLWFQLQNLAAILDLSKDLSVLHCASWRDFPILPFLKRQFRCPVITTIYAVPREVLRAAIQGHSVLDWSAGDFGYHVVEYVLDDFMFRSSLNNSDHVVACGDHTLRGILGTNNGFKRSKCSVIYNGIDFDSIRSNSRLNDAKNEASILFFGRLYVAKGILSLIRALPLIINEVRDAKLEIFGDGPLRGKIVRLVSALRLQDRVHLHGYLSHDELMREVERADVVALPSSYETGPSLAALETMALGKPLVALDLPFSREFIRSMETGLLAEEGNIRDLARKISMLLSDDKLRHKLGNSASEYVRKHHNWDVLVDKYIQVYEKCASQSPVGF